MGLDSRLGQGPGRGVCPGSGVGVKGAEPGKGLGLWGGGKERAGDVGNIMGKAEAKVVHGGFQVVGSVISGFRVSPK